MRRPPRQVWHFDAGAYVFVVFGAHYRTRRVYRYLPDW
ncbi:hypothetical protein BZL29_7276 [Mycobacterium kansasii]|uniref:Uncharacterized protein n=1 Tax=Mycobacterium kansasii TaxID=1768 RepID=A0A1V3WK55_MYCKA|nr:hypothetical protein BZL29_7276 [Mycobacterium kansasii]